jgi:AcrR family transcriptional regulator
MSQRQRPYKSPGRKQAADENRKRILDAARRLFARKGVDQVTIGDIAARAGVSAPTVYAVFGSKAGILREILSAAIFSARYYVAAAHLDKTTDPIALLRLTARVCRAIYENETREIGLLRGASLFSSALHRLENEFENTRYAMQRARIALLAKRRLLPRGMSVDAARRILWMYTSRDVYRMLVVDGGWSPKRFEAWLAATLVAVLVRPRPSRTSAAAPRRRRG